MTNKSGPEKCCFERNEAEDREEARREAAAFDKAERDDKDFNSR